MSPRRPSGDDLYGGGDLERVYPQPAPDPYVTAHSRAVEPVSAAEPRPGLLVRTGRRFDDWRRRVIPLPDEIVDQYLGHGERVIHSDHPSLQSFIVQNTLLFAGLFVLFLLVIGVAFNGSLVTAGIALLVLSVVLLFLVLKRLGERYTSYVVTNVRIMRIKGIVSRRAHSIPWVRVTDLTYEQTLTGRFFGYGTLHIESANEDSGLRDLEGISDPMKFNQYVVDMDNPTPAVRSRCPLRAAEITVEDVPGEAGWYKVDMKVRPHFKYMGAFFTLGLVGKLDKK